MDAEIKARVAAEPWKYDGGTWLAFRGIHEPHIMEISPNQYASMGRQAKQRYDKKRAQEWDAAAAGKLEWAEKVREASRQGLINLTSPGLSREAKELLLQVEREQERGREQAAQERRQQDAVIHSTAELKAGDRVWHGVLNRYVTLSKVNPSSVVVTLEDGKPYPAPADPPTHRSTTMKKTLSVAKARSALDRAKRTLSKAEDLARQPTRSNLLKEQRNEKLPKLRAQLLAAEAALQAAEASRQLRDQEAAARAAARAQTLSTKQSAALDKRAERLQRQMEGGARGLQRADQQPPQRWLEDYYSAVDLRRPGLLGDQRAVMEMGKRAIELWRRGWTAAQAAEAVAARCEVQAEPLTAAPTLGESTARKPTKAEIKEALRAQPKPKKGVRGQIPERPDLPEQRTKGTKGADCGCKLAPAPELAPASPAPPAPPSPAPAPRPAPAPTTPAPPTPPTPAPAKLAGLTAEGSDYLTIPLPLRPGKRVGLEVNSGKPRKWTIFQLSTGFPLGQGTVTADEQLKISRPFHGLDQVGVAAGELLRTVQAAWDTAVGFEGTRAKEPKEPKASKPKEPKASKPKEPKASKPKEPKASKPKEPKAGWYVAWLENGQVNLLPRQDRKSAFAAFETYKNQGMQASAFQWPKDKSREEVERDLRDGWDTKAHRPVPGIEPKKPKTKPKQPAKDLPAPVPHREVFNVRHPRLDIMSQGHKFFAGGYEFYHVREGNIRLRGYWAAPVENPLTGGVRMLGRRPASDMPWGVWEHNTKTPQARPPTKEEAEAEALRIDSAGSKRAWLLRGAQLLTPLRSVAWAMSTDLSRPHLNGVWVSKDGVYCTNGHVMAIWFFGQEWPVSVFAELQQFNAEGPGLFLRADFVAAMLRNLKTDPIEIGWAEPGEVFASDKAAGLRALASRGEAFDQKVPPYKQVLQVLPRSFVIQKSAFMGAFESALAELKKRGLTAKDKLAQIWSAGGCPGDACKILAKLVFSASELAGPTQEIEVPARSEGKAIGAKKISFDSRYLEQAISHAPTEELTIHTGGELDPIRVESGPYTAMVMPMRL